MLFYSDRLDLVFSGFESRASIGTDCYELNSERVRTQLAKESPGTISHSVMPGQRSHRNLGLGYKCSFEAFWSGAKRRLAFKAYAERHGDLLDRCHVSYGIKFQCRRIDSDARFLKCLSSSTFL